MSQISFYGGVGTVTGSNFLLDTGEAKVLVDCGLIQGDRFAMEANCEPFPYDPAEIDVLVVTHAHADHIGRIPKLIADGFRGRIIATEPTVDLAALMLRDAYHVTRVEAKRHGTRPCYEEPDVEEAIRRFEGIPYRTPIELPGGLSLTFQNAGHILGSAFAIFRRRGKTFVFTGDIGNVPQLLLDPPDIPTDYQYLLMESVYGDRLHEEVGERSDMLLQHLLETQKKGSTLIIPAFSLERTQGMLLEINNFVEQELMEPIPVFLDSPLAISVTEVYRKHTRYLKKEVREQIANGDDIFNFAGLSFTKTVEDSREIDRTKGAKVIIAGSGMSHGGRILGHEKRYLEDPKTTLLLVGYQSVGSLGRLLHDGAKRVRIDGKDVRVRAKIARIRGYSGHADRDQLIDFVERGGEQIEKVFVTMGEERASLFLTQRLRDYLGVNAVVPELGTSEEIDF